MLTTYFTSQGNPVRNLPVFGDDFSYIEGWHRSLHELGLHGTIFHDGLSDDFVAAQSTPRVDFVYEDPAGFRYTLNDQRFFVYRRYLRRHPEIERVFLTDGSDVVIAGDPFPHLAADSVFVGSENATLHPPPCEDDERAFGHHTYAIERLAAAGLSDFVARLKSEKVRRPVLNAGLLGGHRHVVTAVLDHLTRTLEAIGRPEENLNMGVFNYVLYRHFEDRLVTGPPVHSVFGRFETWRRDVWFIHK